MGNKCFGYRVISHSELIKNPKAKGWWVEGFDKCKKSKTTLIIGTNVRGRVKPFTSFNLAEKKKFDLLE